MMERLARRIPLVAALRGYSRADLRGDLPAGLTTAVMLIPQGMAYALLAGLPPIVGLYASTVPLVLYALFGTSRQLAVGPVAMVSLLVASGVGAVATPGTAEYVGYAVLLMAMVGALQLAMGVARLGFLVNFLSHPVVSGFTSAAAIVIGLSQLPHLVGIQLDGGHDVFSTVTGVFGRLGAWHLPTVAIGAASIALLVALKRWKPAFPSALVAVVLATGATLALGLEPGGVKVVGEVPDGLPGLAFPAIDGAALQALLPTALTIALVGFLESISVARSFARRNRYEVDANQELIGLGAANLAGSLFQGYPVTGGFSRTAVNAQAGARTGVAAIITAAVIALTLLALTPLFHSLPKAALAAIIMVAVAGLVDVREVRHLWKVKRGDLLQLAVTFVATLALGVEEGILVGVGTALLAFVVRTTRPHAAVLGRLPGTTVWRNVERFPQARPTAGVLAVRVDAQFYFGNVTFLKSFLAERLQRLERESDERVRAVVLDASSINQLDASADAALHEIVQDLRAQGRDLWLAAVKGPVRDVMERSGFDRVLGADHIAFTVEDAVRHAAGERRDTAAAVAAAA